MLLALIWKFDFPPFMVLIIAILNDGQFSSSILNKYLISSQAPISSRLLVLLEYDIKLISTVSWDKLYASPVAF